MPLKKVLALKNFLKIRQYYDNELTEEKSTVKVFQEITTHYVIFSVEPNCLTFLTKQMQRNRLMTLNWKKVALD